MIGVTHILNYIILGMVRAKTATGYDIKKFIENSIGVFYKASYGSIYPSLKKLTDSGCLTMYEEPSGGRKKIFYGITEKGEKTFMEWLTSPPEVLDGMNTHLAKVFFFDGLPPDIRSRQLLQYESNNEAYLQKLKNLERDFDKLENKNCYYYKLSILYYGICITQQTIEWCRHIRNGKPLKNLLTEGFHYE